MKRAVIFIIVNLCFLNTLLAQSRLDKSCKELEIVSFKDLYVEGRIISKLKETLKLIRASSKLDLKNCNCADSIWVSLNNIKRYSKRKNLNERAPHSTLRMIPTKLDKEILKKEFEFLNLTSLEDSLQYIILRHNDKLNRRYTPLHNWMNFYHCIEAESEFLKQNKYKLKELYFELFDNANISEELRDLIIIS